MEVGLGPVRPGSPCSSSFFTLGEPPAAGSRPSPPLPAGPVAAEGLPPPSAVMALDPAEQHLRHVEKDVLIPKIMREKAKERCSGQVEEFTKHNLIALLLNTYFMPFPLCNIMKSAEVFSGHLRLASKYLTVRSNRDKPGT
ncbi:COX assembly mitochondrial protein homolog isoform X3 [Perognathus longimembris pacificus]|uniref:COX assembly mitochondrial protein homolog isoform X3 n=1 Tax=Perognathus longimembris pacificus TaxID=214514 RepID=UPI002018AED8|nr:COX assembly mitochondrial protein homolog isoform X3 [Perognathus longimembris pacificus]